MLIEAMHATVDVPDFGSDVPLPLHYRLRERLRREIREQGLQPGDRLPTEAELEARHGVSRSTIRRALADLAAEGLVRRIQGKGTFVGTPRIQHTQVLTSFSELLRAQGYTPTHRLLGSVVAHPPPEVAEALEIPVDAACRYLHRLFLADGEPVGVAETWLPRARLGVHDVRFEARALGDGSLYELLEGDPLNLVLQRAVETVRPWNATAEDADLLRCEPGSPLLLIQRTTRTVDDEPIERTHLRFVGGRYEYRVELHRLNRVWG